jgi:hypothetical protein
MPASRLFRAALAVALGSCASPVADAPSTPEARAVRFLAREVPDWPLKNKCYSCHNNGDAARALYAARSSSIAFDPAALETTARWLRRPDDWKHNGPPGEFNDKRLATLQFAHALVAGVESGALEAKRELLRAAGRVRDLQDADGSWAVDADGLPGSPVTYGRTLATVVALKVFLAADRVGFAEAITRAERWLRNQKPVGVLDAAALLLGPASQHDECLELIRKGQSRDGGWGPYVTSPPEIFDTALALLGLARLRDRAGVPELIHRGRGFLVRSQREDGSWPETTRPPGAQSYAQRISTTGWATLALLANPQ